MEIKIGIPVSPGVAIAPALVLDSESFRIPKRFIRKDEVEQETKRFEAARKKALSEISGIKEGIHSVVKEEVASIFGSHIMILNDPKLLEEIREKISAKRYTPEYAVSRVFRKVIKAFQEIQDAYFSQRVNDFYDIQKRLLRNLLGQKAENLSKLDRKVVIVAHDLSPSQTATLDKSMVVGFATDAGGATSHTAILANALGIPAVVGLGTLSQDISGGDVVVIDGKSGRVIVNPDDETRERYEERVKGFEERGKKLAATAAKAERTTKDGQRVTLYANVEFDEEVEYSVNMGAEGVGLFRTEFIYAKYGTHPSEEQHLETYAKAHKALGGKVLTLRTMDFGADKYAAEAGLDKEDNPFLGCRSIRLSLREPRLFTTQVRAILRAGLLGPTRMMLPMISGIEEFRQAKELIEGVKADLTREGIDFRKDMPVGMMVEVPSAAIAIDSFIEDAAFFSIGTNDLVQYTIAVDRNNQHVANLFRHTHPAVLRLIKGVIAAGRAANKPVSVCGEMASEARFALLLLGFGLREFSVGPQSIPELRTILSRLTVAEAEQLSEQVMKMGHCGDIDRVLQDAEEKFLPRAEFGE
ncbi:MAG: phosphoenolpyruvate--protein phosphotransferase [Planctomycetes bacterium]|jgi:phosphotransferase system enzyme I (PtsI)|nr:phosphoenolpyruvate--protein phosphotransferase [Planctomycetota bacterium]